MSLIRAYFIGTTLCLVAACGGSVFNSGGDGDGGSSSNAGSQGQAGSGNGSAGKGGTSSTGGSKGMGGSVSVAGTVGIAGGPNCDLVLCAYPECSDGADPITLPGECCPSCPPSQAGCDQVMCQPVMACPAGYEIGTPSGACCKGCVPKPGAVACREIACPPENHCPPGYAPGDTLGGCCYDCVPDPRYCSAPSDCMIANRPRECCGCPEAISRRMYDNDPCWFEPGMPRPLPEECQPSQVCDAICGPCAASGPVSCVQNRCVELPPK